MLHERRRPGQRHLEVDRRRRDLDAAEGRRPRRTARAASRSTSIASSANIVYALIEGRRRGGGRARRPRRRAAGAAGGGRRGGGAAPAAGRRPRRRRRARRPATGLYRSDDGGATWRKVNNANPRPMYFSQVRIDPNNPERVYLGGVGLQMTLDGGRTIETDVAASIHDDIHAIWINPANSESRPDRQRRRPRRLVRHGARTWRSMPNLPVGALLPRQLRHGDPVQRLRRHAGQLQLVRPERVAAQRGILNYDWFQVQGGDGFVVLQDPRDSRIVYSESQDGNIIRANTSPANRRASARAAARRPGASAAFRWHWDTPMMFSPHDPKVVLAAANKVFRSTDRGDSWTAISPDLTTNAGPQRDRDDGREGQRHPDLAQRRHLGVADDRLARRIAEARRPLLHRHRRRRRCR